MSKRFVLPVLVTTAVLALGATAAQAEICEGFGPQTPRDISSNRGTNPVVFSTAPESTELNLCDVHFHRNAEHKGPGFSESAGSGTFGGFRCNQGDAPMAKTKPALADNHCTKVSAGDTIEMHWVFTSCDVAPGPGLGSCLPDHCRNPQLRVETQVFLVTNDAEAHDFSAFDYAGKANEDGRHQPKALPSGTGDPVTFLGSTTGPDFTSETCSPISATWSVRPECAHVSLASLSAWCDRNVFDESEAKGVRQLVTDPALLSKIPAE